MKVVLFNMLNKKEDLEIAKYLGVKIYLYKPYENRGSLNNLIRANEADVDENTLLSIEDLGVSGSLTDYKCLFKFSEDKLRYDAKFISYVETHSLLFPNLKVGETEDGRIFRVKLNTDSGKESLEYLDMSEWFISNNNEKVEAFYQ